MYIYICVKKINLEVFFFPQEVTMIVDRCDMLVIEPGTGKVTDRSPCTVSMKTPGENVFLNINTMLQLGGRYVQPSIPMAITDERFVGCMRNLIHNGEVIIYILMMVIMLLYYHNKTGVVAGLWGYTGITLLHLSVCLMSAL